ncbi:MAG TPA: hypothetical protein VN867_01755 [Candidatus Binataceae bacterium]|nr:hypothetical protein [Candidatus Binataceae bacterium]
MKISTETLARSLVAGAIITLMMSGAAYAAAPAPTPEIDPGMAVGGLTILGIGMALMLERFRRK